MKRGTLRIAAILILMVSVLTLSGLTATAAAMAQQAPGISCLDSGCDDHPVPGAGHGASPDCHCFACITMILQTSISVARVTVDAAPLPLLPPKRHPLSSFVRSIDYPPEAA
ncbi:hypothetical protein [Geomonas ferrireducens]|uniref:hypothetical protein n=1 Tax=Geomonas ferrireducens TaxID=2570227 RepID=UPI0010A93EB1|nr:hypothetical protein [Geomonas ferrireducens]